jgi:RNA polymerase-binding transcription factor DksA
MAPVQTDQEPEEPGLSGSASLELAVEVTEETESYGPLLDEIEGALAEVERALRRLDEGSYGTCEVCGRPSETEAAGVATAGLRCVEHR